MGHNKNQKRDRKVGVIVAHPDDETLWAGGSIIMHPDWHCSIYTLCRGSDLNRSRNFHNAIKYLKANGKMADLNDGPEQKPLSDNDINNTIIKLINKVRFDLVITHSPWGEYTRHRRHEEIGKALLSLWDRGEIQAEEMWLFAYHDDNGSYFPHADKNAHYVLLLPQPIWEIKYKIITDIYGFSQDSWEAQTTPRLEAFWRFNSPKRAQGWYRKKESINENISPL